MRLRSLPCPRTEGGRGSCWKVRLPFVRPAGKAEVVVFGETIRALGYDLMADTITRRNAAPVPVDSAIEIGKRHPGFVPVPVDARIH